MASNSKVRLGRPSDIKAVNDVIARHKIQKEEVIQALKELSERAEGLVIEQVQGEVWSKAAKMVGRGIVLVSGVASLFLLPAAGAGAVVGIGGVVIGYAIVGGSKLFEMRCNREHARKLKDIYDKVEEEVSRYTESQKNIFSELGTLSAFDAGRGFAENLRLIRDIVERAERQANTFFPNIDEVVAKLKKCYISLPEDKKEKLDSQDFLSTMTSLTGGLASAGASIAVDALKAATVEGASSAASAAASTTGSSAATVPWWHVVHGLNIAISGFLLCMDFKQFVELNKMRHDWDEGGEAKQALLKNEKFEKEIQMRDPINKIGDQILSEGY